MSSNQTSCYERIAIVNECLIGCSHLFSLNLAHQMAQETSFYSKRWIKVEIACPHLEPRNFTVDLIFSIPLQTDLGGSTGTVVFVYIFRHLDKECVIEMYFSYFSNMF